MNEKLMALLQKKEEARAVLVDKAEKSENVEELRDIHAQVEAINAELAELRAMLSESDTAQRTKAVTDDETRAAGGEGKESRSYVPGKGFEKLEGASFEARDQKREEAEKRGKDLREGRSVTVASSNIILPKRDSATINPTFNVVSSLIDRVDHMPLQGGESFSQPYEIDTPEGAYTGESENAHEADVIFGYAEIGKTKVTAYSEITNEVRKLPAADYESVVMNGISKSMRRKLTKEILVGDGATGHLTGIFSAKATAIQAEKDLGIGTITNTTLNEIIFSFGGDEDVEDGAVLILHKLDLKAFSQLRTTDGKPFHTIKSNGNTGTIDGVPYILNSACKPLSAAGTAAGAYAMAYGPLSSYKLVIFSDADVQRSTDYKFREGMICHRGEVYAGGNVVVYNGFLRIKKAAAV